MHNKNNKKKRPRSESYSQQGIAWIVLPSVLALWISIVNITSDICPDSRLTKLDWQGTTTNNGMNESHVAISVWGQLDDDNSKGNNDTRRNSMARNDWVFATKTGIASFK